MEVTKRVALEIAQHEGMVRQAYRDCVGVWTWSVGITSASGHKVNRYIDNPQPMERCIEVWLWVLEKYAADVRRAFNGRDLSEAEFFGVAQNRHHQSRFNIDRYTKINA